MKTINLLFFLSFALSWAQQDSRFVKGNRLYNDGKYRAAIESYEAVLADSLHSPELYFNLGNAHYKLSEVAPSIYYYEKGLQLSPKNKNIANNLTYAQKMVIDKIEILPEPTIKKFRKSLMNMLSLNSWGVICIVFMVLFVGFFSAYYVSRKSNQKRTFFLLACSSIAITVFCYALAFSKSHALKLESSGVAFSKKIEVMVDPNFRSETSFIIHEGTKFQVIESFNSVWSRIKIANGKTGWIPNDSFKLL